MYALVADVERYPQFLPWCISCKIITRLSPHQFTADLVVGHGFIRERFLSEVTLAPETEVHVRYLKGPMRHLSNHWKFVPQPDGGCAVDFYVDFEFKTPVLQKLMGVFFGEIVKRMVGAFEARAKALYGAVGTAASTTNSQQQA